MNTADKIFQEVRTLPESVAREVLDFVGYLKAKHAEHPKVETADMSEFDQFGAVFDGKFNRAEYYSVASVEQEATTVRRRPSPKLKGTRIIGDIMSPAVPARD